MNLSEEILSENWSMINCYAHYGGVDSNPEYYDEVPVESVGVRAVLINTNLYDPCLCYNCSLKILAS